jgi:holo-[acyl-carrier protein] synthase
MPWLLEFIDGLIGELPENLNAEVVTEDDEIEVVLLEADELWSYRFRKSYQRLGTRFITRLFTEKEQQYCQKYKDALPHFAARFSAKEAVVKALGTGFDKHASWKDIEILNDPQGRPFVTLSPSLEKKCAATYFLISISHTAHHVTAVAIWVAE